MKAGTDVLLIGDKDIIESGLKILKMIFIQFYDKYGG